MRFRLLTHIPKCKFKITFKVMLFGGSRPAWAPLPLSRISLPCVLALYIPPRYNIFVRLTLLWTLTAPCPYNTHTHKNEAKTTTATPTVIKFTVNSSGLVGSSWEVSERAAAQLQLPRGCANIVTPGLVHTVWHNHFSPPWWVPGVGSPSKTMFETRYPK